MATDSANLATIKSNLLAKLAEISANPKPNYSIDGQSVSWGDYFSMLMSQVSATDALIAQGEPYEVISYAYPDCFPYCP